MSDEHVIENEIIDKKRDEEAAGKSEGKIEEKSEKMSLFDVNQETGSDSEEQPAKQGSEGERVQNKEEASTPSSEWFLEENIQGKGELPEWFEHKKFETVAEQAKAYNEARKQISKYGEQLKGFSGAPDEYSIEKEDKENLFAIGLQEAGKKLGLSQSGFEALLPLYKQALQDQMEQAKETQQTARKEALEKDLKKIGGKAKLDELEAKFIESFGEEVPVDWLKKTVRSYEDYQHLEKIASRIAHKTRLPIHSMESSISTKAQAEEYIRDPRWGKNKEFTEKANEILQKMLQ